MGAFFLALLSAAEGALVGGEGGEENFRDTGSASPLSETFSSLAKTEDRAFRGPLFLDLFCNTAHTTVSQQPWYSVSQSAEYSVSQQAEYSVSQQPGYSVSPSAE